MLSGLFRWRSSQSTPQEDFRRLHATLCAPPPACPSNPAAKRKSSDAAVAAHAHIVDPYHFIICQHGVLSTSADFDNVITDLFIHHEVSVLEAAELASAAVKRQPTEASPAAALHRRVATSSEDATSLLQSSHRFAAEGDVPRTSSPTVTYTTSSCASPATAAHTSHDATQCTAESSGVKGDAPTPSAGPLRPDTALTQEQRARRDAYKATFKLAVEYPNRTNGRLYRSGNLRVFSPGSNNYLRSDAGTLACARKMLAETVPQLHAWLDDVEARERQRQAQWSVYARTVNTPEAARLAREAARPLPVCLSFMAHSFGGIIERECVYLLFADTTETQAQSAVLYDAILQLRRRLRTNGVTFENFLTIATPHCGAGECLWWPIYFGAWCLARLHLCQTYDELILSDAERVLQTRLLDAPHLKVLELFRRRVLFANTHRDLLVGFGTCSLIFENVDTDHTKFVGVTAQETHCAAAFADDTIEISKPIVLRSFAEEEAEEAETRNTSLAERRSHTLQDLDKASIAPDTAVVHDRSIKLVTALGEAEEGEERGIAGGYLDVDEDDNSETETEGAHGESTQCVGALSDTLRPQPTFSSLSGLTASSTSPLSAITAASSSSAAMLQDSVFAAAFTIGHDVPSHAMEEMTLEEVVGPSMWANDAGEEMGSGMLTVVMDPASGLPESVEASGSSSSTSNPSCISLSPVSQAARSLSVLRGSPSGEGHARVARFTPSSPAFASASVCSPLSVMPGGSDSDSASSSRRSRGSRVTSVLRDPRWASEHVRHAASSVHGELCRRLSSATSLVLGSEVSVAGMTASTCGTPSSPSSSANAAAAAGVAMAAGCGGDVGFSTASYLIPSDDIPQYRKTPRAIAARLREKLSWRVRAVRFDNVIPVGHVACLGNWAFCGRSQLLVESVAEELLIVLN